MPIVTPPSIALIRHKVQIIIHDHWLGRNYDLAIAVGEQDYEDLTSNRQTHVDVASNSYLRGWTDACRELNVRALDKPTDAATDRSAALAEKIARAKSRGYPLESTDAG